MLEVAATDDPIHGAQKGSACHGAYRRHKYHPSLVVDGAAYRLVTAAPHPGNTLGDAGDVAVRKRVVRGLRERWPMVTVGQPT